MLTPNFWLDVKVLHTADERMAGFDCAVAFEYSCAYYADSSSGMVLAPGRRAEAVLQSGQAFAEDDLVWCALVEFLHAGR